MMFPRVFLLIIMGSIIAGCAMSAASQKQASYHYQMGLSYLGENNVTGALVELTSAEKIDPDNHELMNYLGLAYFRKNKLDIAEKKFLRSIALKPDYSDARNNLAVTYLEMKRWDDAIYQLKLVSDDIFYQNQAATGINLALAYYGKGDFDQALATLRPLASNNPTDPRIRFTMGRVYYAMEKTDLAVGEYRKAIEMYANYAQAHYNLALATMKQGDKRGAAKSFREVVRIAPDTEIGQLSKEYLQLLK
ncbi:MAG TPA: tetratricopeptide repeat protein [Geobacteraceae bacterium]|nr:tetratricopeptide repeat protein [Geobacteraceae bacterium]